MPPQQQGGGGQDPGTSDFAWLSIIAVGGVVLIWYFFQRNITNFVFTIRFYELKGIDFLLDQWNWLALKAKLPWFQIHIKQTLSQLSDYAVQARSGGSTPAALKWISSQVGSYLRLVFSPLLLAFAIIIYTTNIHLKLKTVFNMQKMKISEKLDQPQIIPVLNLDLVKEDIDKGPWAMSMTPMQFCKKHKLLKEKTDDRGKPAVELIPGKAYQVFVTQLGPFWTHVMALPPHAKALFAILAACGNHDRDGAFGLLRSISESAEGKKLNFAGTDELLKQHFNTKLVIRVLQRHAYVSTVFLSMMELARTDGVLPTSEFIWLKPLDRKLWYVLNTVGRYTPVSEAAGPYCHWLAEKKWGGPLRTPMMEEAIKAMEGALAEILYDPEDEGA